MPLSNYKAYARAECGLKRRNKKRVDGIMRRYLNESISIINANHPDWLTKQLDGKNKDFRDKMLAEKEESRTNERAILRSYYAIPEPAKT